MVIGLTGLSVRSVGAQTEVADGPAVTTRTTVGRSGPVAGTARTPQVQYDDRLQATFTIGADEHGATVLGVDSDYLRVRKTILADQTQLDVVDQRGDRVRLSVRRGVIAVTRGRRSATVTLPLAADALEQVQAILFRSSAVRTFRALARAGESTRTDSFFDGILTSAAVFGVLQGDPHATDAVRARARSRSGARLLPAAWQWSTKDCWDAYVGSAIPIYDEYVDCTSDLSWYDVLGKASCEAIYVVEAELAFSWLVACNGGFFAQ